MTRAELLVRSGATFRWAVVTAYVGVIFGTIPFAPRLWLALSRAMGIELRPLALIILLLAGLAVSAGVSMRRPDRLTCLTLVALAAIYAVLYQVGFETPAERLHLAEYGLLPGLVAWAWPAAPLRHRRLVAGVLVSIAVGCADELIQGLTPGRFGQFRDVMMNGASALLGSLAWARVMSGGARFDARAAE